MELILRDFRDENWRNLVAKARIELANQLQKAWVVGDILKEVTSKYGEHTIKKFCEDIGLGSSTAYSYRKLAMQFPTEERAELLNKFSNLTYGHYSLLANKNGLTNKEVGKYLEDANNKNLSIRSLKSLIDTDNPIAHEDNRFIRLTLPNSLIEQFVECRRLSIELLRLNDVDPNDINSNDMVKEKIMHGLFQLDGLI